MARNVNETEADEATQGGNIMERDAFLDVLATVSTQKGKIAKLTGNVSALLNKAENDHNMDKKAFAVIQWARRQEPTRVNAFLRHFDAYRKYADLDAMAGADMFVGSTKGGPEKATRKGNGLGLGIEAAPAKQPKGARKPKDAPKTGKRRGRPPKNAPPSEPVSVAEAAAKAWGLSDATETHGAA